MTMFRALHKLIWLVIPCMIAIITGCVYTGDGTRYQDSNGRYYYRDAQGNYYYQDTSGRYTYRDSTGHYYYRDNYGRYYYQQTNGRMHYVTNTVQIVPQPVIQPQYVDNSDLAMRVRANLAANNETRNLPITVRTYNGTVELLGYANSDLQKQLAIGMTQRVSGVQMIKDGIIVTNSFRQ